MSVECYAQRLLNPFRGVLNTIRYESAEAVTLDGVHWDIYVSNEKLLDDLHQSHRVQVSDIRYGSWSLEQGLKAWPTVPLGRFPRHGGNACDRVRASHARASSGALSVSRLL